MGDPLWMETDEEPDHSWADRRLERMWEDG